MTPATIYPYFVLGTVLGYLNPHDSAHTALLPWHQRPEDKLREVK